MTKESNFDPFELKPEISESSRHLYVFNLTKLNNGKPIKDLKFLLKEEILDKIKELKPNTQRTYLISIVSALRGRNQPTYKKLYAKYYDLLMDLNKKLKDNTTKTEKVSANWLSQDCVLQRQKEMSSILTEIKHKKKLHEEDYNKLLHLVVVSLYTLQKPRRNKDYAEMMVVKRLPESENCSINYLETEKWNWVFNNYKTQKKYQQQVLPIPLEMQEILKIYLKYHPKSKEIKKKQEEPFLVQFDGTPINTSPEMTRLLNKIFGKKIGCSMLRAIYLTDKYGDSVQQMKQDVKDMGTSAETAENNYIKQTPPI
jgi:integrase